MMIIFHLYLSGNLVFALLLSIYEMFHSLLVLILLLLRHYLHKHRFEWMLPMLPFKSSFLIIKIKLPVLWVRTKNSEIIDAVEHLQLQCFWHNYTLFICIIYVDHQKRKTFARKRCIGEQWMDSFTAYITFGLCPFSLWPKFFTTTFQKLIHMYSLISKCPIVLLYTHRCHFISVHKNMAFSAPVFFKGL